MGSRHGGVAPGNSRVANVARNEKNALTTGWWLPHTHHCMTAKDDVMNMLAVRGMLEHLGHEVVTAGNGQEAVALLRDEEFDVVVMDIQMPVLDGVEATRRIREDVSPGRRRFVPIIAMTAYAMSGDRETFLEAGMSGYVSKPFDRKTLCETIASALGAAGKSGRGGDVRERYENS